MLWKTEPGPYRATLGFVEVVLAAFEFLIKEHKFHCTQTEVTFVRYESETVYVNIYHGRASFELGFEIGLLSEIEERKFTLGEIIDLANAQKDAGDTFFQASKTDRVQMLVPRLAELVKKYAGSALIGKSITFKELEDLRSRRSKELHKAMELRWIRQKVDEAWRKKDYANVVELYKPVRKDLTSSESKKFEYAEKQLAKK